MTIRLETDRLILKPLAPEDADAHIAMMQEPDIARYLTNEGIPRSRTDEWRAYASMLGHAQLRGFGFFSVFEKSTGEWVGRVGPWMPEEWPALECGWAIGRNHWGKGYAPEAAIASINWIFETYPDLPRIISAIDPKNENSQAVARKIGETKSGETFKLWNFELDVWSAKREEWLQRFGS